MYESGKTTTLWNYSLWAAERRTSGIPYQGVLRMWLTLSVCNRQGLAALVFSLALIHPSVPWPGKGHPDAMKMEVPPRLFSHQCVEALSERLDALEKHAEDEE